MWPAYYHAKIARQGSYPAYHALKIQENTPFLNELYRHLPPGGNVLELGIGPGAYVIELTRQGFGITGLDIDAGVLQLARENAATLQTPIQVVQADLFATRFAANAFALAFSVGVLEHFPDEAIVRGIQEALRIAPRFIFAIPCIIAADPNAQRQLNAHGFFGDERYLPVAHWETLIEEAGARLIRKFGYRIPAFASTTRHPPEEELESYYGRGIFAVYHVVGK